ncbi:MAG: ankyrin repeat domain-containing protein [Candidatus Thiodiazotropha sp.]
MSYQDVQPEALASVTALPDLTIIDQRDELTRSRGQLPGALAPRENLIASLVQQRHKNPAVLVYCYHGNQSRELCAFLSQLGLNQVFNLAGGWEAWSRWQAQQSVDDNPHTGWLREHGFDPDDLNCRIDLGMSALMLASLQGDLPLVNYLLERGVDPNPSNDDGHHALWFACVNGDLQLVGRLIEAGAKVDNRNVNGVTCAVYAASTGKLEVLKQLLAGGADPAIRTNDGYNALDSASTLEVLRFLRPLLRNTG